MTSADERALAWLAARPDFETGSPSEQAAARLPLERPLALIERLGRPDRGYRVIQVAGTKGKGSTAVLIGAVLEAHGLQVGLYTQPHLYDPCERLRLNGVAIEPGERCALIARLRPVVEALEAERPELGALTAYEITTVLGLIWFAERRADWVVLEVGLGGRLDATSIVEPTVAVITPISFDHMHVLGRTLKAIASEKAGIVKTGARVVSAPQRPAALAVIRKACARADAGLTIVGGRADGPRAERVRPRVLAADAPLDWSQPFFEFDAIGGRGEYGSLSLWLGGRHQLDNALTALAALEAAAERGLALEPTAVARGFAAARWPGRLEVAQSAPLVMIDGAHNGDSAAALRRALDLHFRFERLLLVLGVFDDKDLAAILKPFRDSDRVFAVDLPSPRSRPAGQVAATAARLGISATSAGDVATGLRTALEAAGPADLVCVTGSLTAVAIGRRVLGLGPDSA